jgi:uncharacterized protein (DUF2267 family)
MHIFEKHNQEAQLWIDEMMAELGTDDPYRALHALRAGLQALRDRMTLAEAAQMAAELPLLIRGLFFDGWLPGAEPRPIEKRSEFLALVREKYAPRSDTPTDQVARATLAVLDHRLTGRPTLQTILVPTQQIVTVSEVRAA